MQMASEALKAKLDENPPTFGATVLLKEEIERMDASIGQTIDHIAQDSLKKLLSGGTGE